mmetsp:Transcript_55765/g.154485  ORF Transcript_55765/g.154485 Transcript_55765/m.154485 type:complete len:89 (+) Transcript_55765:43-309(+)
MIRQSHVADGPRPLGLRRRHAAAAAKAMTVPSKHRMGAPHDAPPSLSSSSSSLLVLASLLLLLLLATRALFGALQGSGGNSALMGRPK